MEADLGKHIQVQLGFETVYQLLGTTILLFYANSQTRTSQGLAAFFEQKEFNVLGISLTSKTIVALLLAMNLISLIKAHMNRIIAGNASNYSLMGKFMMLICIFCNSIVRVMSITLYFTPSMGLFNVLHHYQGWYFHTFNISIT